MSWHFQDVIHNYRPHFHNLQTRKKMVQTIQIELSINSNTARSQIYINAYVTGHLQGMFYDSITQYNLLIDKVAEKVPWTIYRS